MHKQENIFKRKLRDQSDKIIDQLIYEKISQIKVSNSYYGKKFVNGKS